MPTKLIFVGLVALSALSRPVASDTKPEMCLCEFVAPRYSPIARTAVGEGFVTVEVKVRASGEISEIWPWHIVSGPGGDTGQPSSPDVTAIFTEDAVTAVKQWRFCPGPEGRKFNITFVFELTEPGIDGWAPTEVSFHSPATVEISTARNSQTMSSTKAK
jgi:hypothetical protein